jgi:ubiquinone/menaquinone biosynthesis C-methylase UbiE
MKTSPVYVLGHDEPELARLQLQARIIGGVTRRLIRESGIARGMRVLDIGCGGGDVSLLLAEAVGAEGRVVAIDREARAIEFARARAAELGLAQIEFRVATEEAIPGSGFDAAFGRYVLIHQPDPVAFLRRVAGVVRPGGILAFHEIALHLDALTRPLVGLHHTMSDQITSAYRALLPSHDVAGRLFECFATANLPTPHVIWESIVGDHRTELMRWLAMSYFSMRAHIEELGFEPLPQRNVDELAAKLRAAAAENRAQIVSRPQVCAWVVRE